MSTDPSNDDLDALARRLGRLPEPPIPAGLEARLRTTIPDTGVVAGSQARRHDWSGRWLVGGLAAAVVLVTLAIHWFGRRPHPNEILPSPHTAPRVAAQQLPAPRNRRWMDGDIVSAPYSFEWPVQLRMPTRAQHLPAELTDY